MYRLATMHNVTYRRTDTRIDRRTDNFIVPIADHTACSTIGW